MNNRSLRGYQAISSLLTSIGTASIAAAYLIIRSPNISGAEFPFLISVLSFLGASYFIWKSIGPNDENWTLAQGLTYLTIEKEVDPQYSRIFITNAYKAKKTPERDLQKDIDTAFIKIKEAASKGQITLRGIRGPFPNEFIVVTHMEESAENVEQIPPNFFLKDEVSYVHSNCLQFPKPGLQRNTTYADVLCRKNEILALSKQQLKENKSRAIVFEILHEEQEHGAQQNAE